MKVTEYFVATDFVGGGYTAREIALNNGWQPYYGPRTGHQRITTECGGLVRNVPWVFTVEHLRSARPPQVSRSKWHQLRKAAAILELI